MAIPKMALAVAGSALSAVGQIQAGKAQAKAYEAQAKQAEIQGKQKALEYKQEGLQTLRRLRQNVSATRARASAAGLNPTSGTPASFERYAMRVGREEFGATRENAILAAEAGVQQAAQYNSAASQAKRQGYIGAIGTLGSMSFQVQEAGGFSQIFAS